MNIKPGMSFSQNELQAPKNEYAVTYMWFWNEPITRELIDAELSEYKKAGISSIYIVPLPKDFRPETIRTFLSPEYLTDEFFEYVVSVAEGKETKNEINDYREISIFKDGVTL